ncbi:hypothetical protein IGK30_003578 [Enterococcus sp. AZ178]
MYLDVNASSQYKLVPYLRTEKSPFVVICPGGGYEMAASGIEGLPYAKRLNDMGYSAFVLYYHTKDQAQAPQPMEDLVAALTYIFENQDELNVETQDYAIWGSSAGGHLAALFGTKKLGYQNYGLPKPKVIVLSYPVISMTDELSHKGSRMRLLGNQPSLEDKFSFSVEKQVDSTYPATFIWSSVQDETVPNQNSKVLYDKLCEKNVKSCFLSFSQGNHGIGLARGEFSAIWFQTAVAFMNEIRREDEE